MRLPRLWWLHGCGGGGGGKVYFHLAIWGRIFVDCRIVYRGANKGVHVMLSRTQAGPDTTVKQEQEEISRNHVQGSAKRSADFVKQQPGRARQKS